MGKKINVYYKNKGGQHFYIWSTDQFKTVKEALENAKKHFRQSPFYKKAYKGKIKEDLVLTRLYASFKK